MTSMPIMAAQMAAVTGESAASVEALARAAAARWLSGILAGEIAEQTKALAMRKNR